VQLPDELSALGLDAGADSIRELLARDSINLSRSTTTETLTILLGPVCCRIVADTFTSAAHTPGDPTSTLTDNGMVYTTRYARGTAGPGPGNAFETLLALHGITQQNGKPFQPTTPGEIERFSRTQKKHLAAQHSATISKL
jgi:hypothetical protein